MKTWTRHSLLAVFCLLLLLPMIPASAFAGGARITYPDGSPVIGAQVNLVVDDASTKTKKMAFTPPPVSASPVELKWAAMQKKALLTPKKKLVVVSDATGRFSIPEGTSGSAMIQIKAPDGKDFATVTLPAKLFSTGDVAIVLQPRK